MSDCLIAPSVLAADFGKIVEEIEMLNNSEADYIHIDIMDGVFVPNISFGFPVTNAIAKTAKKPMDFHLMITNPDLYLSQCKDSGAEIITVHYEACTHLHRTVQAIKSLGLKAGVALNPHTSIDLLDDIFTEMDLLLIMSVNPGFGGQKFIPRTYEKISKAREKANRQNPELLIEIDGGVTLENHKQLVQKGANMLVAGNTVFKSEDPIHTIAALKDV